MRHDGLVQCGQRCARLRCTGAWAAHIVIAVARGEGGRERDGAHGVHGALNVHMTLNQVCTVSVTDLLLLLQC